MPDPFVPAVDGDRMGGRGASDMKAGVGAMVVAAEELVGRRLPGRVVLALVADEEDASLGAEAVLAALPGSASTPTSCVVGEPTSLAITESLRGYALVEVTFSGRAAHSSQPDQGVNAVVHLGRLLHAVEERHGTLRRPGEPRSMVTVASGGELTPSCWPARPAPWSNDARCPASAPRPPSPRSRDPRRPPAPPTPRSTPRPGWSSPARPGASTTAVRPRALSATLEAALAAQTPARAVPQRSAAPAWMEAPLWQAAGIPALVCGPDGGGMHAADEWVDLDQVRRYTVALTEAVARWAAEHAD